MLTNDQFFFLSFQVVDEEDFFIQDFLIYFREYL